jgi:hypothetical protein
MEYADRLSADVGIKKFTDSTGCAVHVSGFYNQTMKQGEKPNSITIALMEGIKKFLGKDAGTANQPRIGIDIQWTGLNDGFREGQPSVSTRIETTPTVGSHFAKENVEAFTNAITSYTDTSFSIGNSHADERIIVELKKMKKGGKTFLEEYNTNVIWVSQKDTSLFKKCAPYMPTFGTIVTANFSNNNTKYTATTYDNASLNKDTVAVNNAINYMKEKLKSGRPVLIGVHYTGVTYNPPNNNNRATRHFMIVVGYEKKGGVIKFWFYDPGRDVSKESEATSINNVLLVNKEKGCLQGTYQNITYTLTEVVKTN